MAPVRPLPVPVCPNATERAALATVAGYLRRAGSATSTMLLSFDGTGDCSLAHAVRDQYDASAALCLALLDAVDESDAWLLRLP